MPRLVIFLPVYLLVLGGLACNLRRGQPAPKPMILNFALHDGFSNDTVTVSVNGLEVYRKSGVTTDLSISYADAVEIPLSQPLARIELSIVGKRSGAFEVDVGESPYVAARVYEGRLEFKKSSEPFPLL